MLLSDLIRRYRASAGLSQKELADETQLSLRTISALERGETLTTQPHTARQLADAFGLTGSARTEFLQAAFGPQAPALAAATRTLPSNVANFIGREADLATLRHTAAKVGRHGGAPQVCVIHGMPGTGKTAVALHFAHEVANRFPDGQLFVRLYGHASEQMAIDPDDALSALLLADGVAPTMIPESLDARSALWRDRLAGRKVLLLFDDAIDTKQVLPLLPGNADALVLITTRQRLSALLGAVSVDIGLLSHQDAVGMFARLADRPDVRPHDEPVADAVRLCGYLPIAIGLLAGYLQEHRTRTVADIVADMVASGDRLRRLAAEHVSVAAAFDLSYRNLPSGLQRFFRRLALHPGPDIDRHTAAVLDRTDPVSAGVQLDRLFDCHLIDEVDAGRYRFHDLIHEHAHGLAAADSKGERGEAERDLLAYYLYLARAAERHLARRTPTGVPAVLVTVPPQAPKLDARRKAIEWMDANYLRVHAAASYAAAYGYPAYTIAISAAMNGFLLHRGHWNQAVDLHRLAVETAEQIGDLHAAAGALVDMGQVQHMTRDVPGAVENLTRALTLNREIGDLLGEANALRRLGALRYATGDLRDGMANLEAALSLYVQIGDKRGEAETISNLGTIQYETGGCLAAAASQTRALNIFRALPSPEGEAHALCFLGEIHAATGRYADAIGSYESALELYRELGSVWHEAGALYYLGAALRAAGDFGSATTNLSRARQLYIDVGDLFDEAGVLNQMGILQTATGDYEQAAASLSRANDIYRDFDSRNGEAEVLNSMGELALAMGAPGEAYDYHARANAIAIDLGIQREEARATEGIGRCRPDQALISLRRAQEIYERLHSPNSARIAAILAAMEENPVQPVDVQPD